MEKSLIITLVFLGMVTSTNPNFLLDASGQPNTLSQDFLQSNFSSDALETIQNLSK
jgi:hypothetical protein